MVVEELLQLLVGEVDAQLFKGVVLDGEKKTEIAVEESTTRVMHGVTHGVMHGVTHGVMHGVTHGVMHGVMHGRAQCTSNYLEDLKACNVQDSNEGCFPLLCVQCLVDAHHQPGEHSLVQGLRQCPNGVHHLRHVPSLLDILVPHTDPWLQQELCKFSGIDSQQVGHLLSICSAGQR